MPAQLMPALGALAQVSVQLVQAIVRLLVRLYPPVELLLARGWARESYPAAVMPGAMRRRFARRAELQATARRGQMMHSVTHALS